MNPILILLASMAISMVIIPVMWRLAPRIGMMDAPDPRKVHAKPVARVGGWGIVLGALIPVFIWLPLDPLIQSYLFGSLVLFAFGTWDDCTEAGHYQKFVGQFIAVVPIVWYGGLYIERLPFMPIDAVLSPAIGMPFTVIALVGMVNAINHSDGLDGLAGGETLLSLIVIGFLVYFEQGTSAAEPATTATLVITAASIGGILGFLRYNTHPAEVFMGDSGSQFLGLTLGVLAVLFTQQVNPIASAALPALLLGLPVIDILAVLMQRAYLGMNLFRASKNHIHHRLLDRGFDHYESVILIYSVQALFVISAFFLRYSSDFLIMSLYLGVCVVLFGFLIVTERKGWKAHRSEQQSPVGEFIGAVKSHPWFRSGPVLVVGIVLPVYLLAGALVITHVPRDFGLLSSVLFFALLIDLLFGKQVGSVFTRATVFVTATFIVYLGLHFSPENSDLYARLELGFFIGLAVAIGLAVRYADDKKFVTTPMDYLVVFVVIAIGALSVSQFEEHAIGLLVIKGMILVYGCELLISRMTSNWGTLTVSSLAALAVLSVRALI